MAHIEVAQGLIFNEDMSSLLLNRGPILVAPCLRMEPREDAFNVIDRLIPDKFGNHIWDLIRTEVYDSNSVIIHTFFCKVSTSIMVTMSERPFTSIVPVKSIHSQKIANALLYLIPMAKVLSEAQKNLWPNP